MPRLPLSPPPHPMSHESLYAAVLDDPADDLHRQVYADWERSMWESRKDATRLVIEHKSHPDRAEGVRSFVERRPPAFQPFTEPFESESR